MRVGFLFVSDLSKMSLLPVLTHEYILVGAPRQFTINKNVGEFVLDHMRDHGDDVAMVNIFLKKSVTAPEKISGFSQRWATNFHME